MKRQIFIFALLGAVTFTAQSQTEIGKKLFKHLASEAKILSSHGLMQGSEETKEFVRRFTAVYGEKRTYTKEFSIAVNRALDYEIGEIKTEDNTFPVMFIKTKSNSSEAKIEFLIIDEKQNPEDDSSSLEERRNKWMELCNSHKANELVKQLYTSDAYYYNRGRLIQGTEALSAEYSYMNASGYSLKLTPKHVTFISPDVAYEIGQCSGSYPYPYMLLWKRQPDGTWQVAMDSNY